MWPLVKQKGTRWRCVLRCPGHSDEFLKRPNVSFVRSSLSQHHRHVCFLSVLPFSQLLSVPHRHDIRGTQFLLRTCYFRPIFLMKSFHEVDTRKTYAVRLKQPSRIIKHSKIQTREGSFFTRLSYTRDAAVFLAFTIFRGSNFSPTRNIPREYEILQTFHGRNKWISFNSARYVIQAIPQV